MSSTFFIPAVNIMGTDCLDDAMVAIRNYGFRKALIVTDAGLATAGVASMIAEKLAMQDIDSVIYDGAKPNPNVDNVEKGLALLKQSACDFVVSLGGGSPHDCAKGIALCATNGGHIGDYEGVDQSSEPQLPLVAINTTAGTASEMTRFCIITDETPHVKMAIVNRQQWCHVTVDDGHFHVAGFVGDDTKAGHLTGCARRGIDGNQWHLWLGRLIDTFVVTDMSAIGGAQGNALGTVMGRAPTQGDDEVCAAELELLQTFFDVANSRIWLGTIEYGCVDVLS